MKGMTRCAVILAAFLVVAGALIIAEAKTHATLGAGNTSCGTWTKDPNEKGYEFYNNSSDPSEVLTVFNQLIGELVGSRRGSASLNEGQRAGVCVT